MTEKAEDIQLTCIVIYMYKYMYIYVTTLHHKQEKTHFLKQRLFMNINI